MTIAIGTDIVEIDRIAKVYARQGDKLATRILTASEMTRFLSFANESVKVSFLAKRWCAKEAIAKALGTGIAKGIGWQEMEVFNNDLGAPIVELNGAAKARLELLNGSHVLISLSDEQHYAVAFCTII
jgi:holo-[acyl-carrier protein] synthase